MHVWKSFVESIRLAVWVKQGVSPYESTLVQKIRQSVTGVSLERLIRLFEIAYEYELAFAKTTTPHIMLEMMLLKMATAQANASSPTPEKPRGQGTGGITLPGGGRTPAKSGTFVSLPLRPGASQDTVESRQTPEKQKTGP